MTIGEPALGRRWARKDLEEAKQILLVGSVSTKVVHRAECDVLVVR